ncbi:MAG: N-dimethylarginine dimethylaminohydrolase [Rhodothermales bacterium]|jgi:N-dimethylarginine dimethylaminohydrolase
MTYRRSSEIDFSLSDLPVVTGPRRVLMTVPAHFQVEYVINPHMAGNVGQVNPTMATEQWDRLQGTYEALGIETHALSDAAGLPDMVFCANQTLPVPAMGSSGPRVVLSRMCSEHRRQEVPAYNTFFNARGYEAVALKEGQGWFEGMGDAIWHPGRYLLWGGYGIRTDSEVYSRLAESLEVPIVMIHLEDPDFYHLDTCFSALSERSVLIYPGAFDSAGLALIRALFEEVIEAPEDESRSLFACNAHCPDGKHVIIQRGCAETVSRLRTAGFEPIEVDTDQFLLAGGSVFCMKQMFW